MSKILSARPRRLGAALALALSALSFFPGCGQSSSVGVAPAAAVAEAPASPAQTDGPAPADNQTALPKPPPFEVADLVERVTPVVVNITSVHQARALRGRGLNPFEPFGGGENAKQTALGTGFIIDASGYVVTNAHVVEGADEVQVRLADDRELEADVVGRDTKLDLALLLLRNANALPAASLGDSNALRVGEVVVAVGNPFGLGHTVTLGIVSAKARTIGAGPYDDFIQTDASINPGNSGGPLFNDRGEVVGINTAIRAGANGIGFAIPIDALKDVLPALREKGRVERGKLGLVFQPISKDLATALGLDSPKGALVSDVEPNAAAARAGIVAGDVIVGVNGTAIGHAEELPRNVARNPPGAEIALDVVRAGKKLEVKAKLDRLDDADPAARAGKAAPAPREPNANDRRLGIQVSNARFGVQIDALMPGSIVSELFVGDVIVAVNGEPTPDVTALQQAIGKVTPGEVALAKVQRGNRVVFAALPVPK